MIDGHQPKLAAAKWKQCVHAGSHNSNPNIHSVPTTGTVDQILLKPNTAHTALEKTCPWIKHSSPSSLVMTVHYQSPLTYAIAFSTMIAPSNRTLNHDCTIKPYFQPWFHLSHILNHDCTIKPNVWPWLHSKPYSQPWLDSQSICLAIVAVKTIFSTMMALSNHILDHDGPQTISSTTIALNYHVLSHDCTSKPYSEPWLYNQTIFSTIIALSNHILNYYCTQTIFSAYQIGITIAFNHQQNYHHYCPPYIPIETCYESAAIHDSKLVMPNNSSFL